ncbi:MAG TPA: hypothetical protein VGD58_24225 [Herpetosiphonaceae bacterium]
MGETDSCQHADHHSSHDEIRDRLPEYATALVLGQPNQTQYAHIAAHIATCRSCHDALQELQPLVEISYTGELMPVATMPQFNLAFLQAKEVPGTPAPVPAQSMHRSWSIDTLGRLVIPLATHVGPAMQQPRLRAARGEALQRWDVKPDLPEDVNITIEIFDTNQPPLVTVQAQLDLALLENPLDQAGRVVHLSGNGHDWQEVTDESGLVRFAPIASSLLPALQLVIEL